MSHWLVAPVLLPALLAPLMLLFLRKRLMESRVLSIASCLSLLALAGLLMAQANDGTIQTYALGDWRAPFGIILVLDRLSALMLMVTAILALAVMIYAVVTGLDRKGWHFHPLFQFQLLGLNGAFLTGDLFNLFVFFEVLLIASYGLMLHGGGAARLKAGVQYVVVNLVGSTLFLVAVGLLYGATGTLNMAHMGQRVAQAPAGDHGLILAGGLLMIAVFALKAAVVPLHFWLPRTYGSTSAPVAALFAIMTKVGAYCILRFTTVVFGDGAGELAWAPAPYLLPAALATMLLGFIGVLGARHLRQLAAFSVIGSMGTLVSAIAVFTPESTAAALYYLPHSTLAAAALFLVADQITRRRGDFGDVLSPSPVFAGAGPLSGLFFLTAIAVVGLPPLSGFPGKLLILDAVRDAPGGWWIWGFILGTTVISLLAFARAGSVLFWKSAATTGEIKASAPVAPVASALVVAGLLASLAALTLAGGPVSAYLNATGEQIYEAGAYGGAVLGPG
ncbi:MAG: monovalent cation/H+ antiporter subunit D [Phenylobacterium sp.]|uniref:monovalent cation/H+ antiporter subunit D n=1 Tax=Phenylobacterium sp. TaxID=1871053 RepID=UPI00273452A7|nr:monovalent cation/H+ antiporter subunit D [Phenylobacterium sp.]MDP1642040.1 monovalent cation/H+ antiporter subunit D [Phenylobacterium sp.]MDP3117490.1 monovalent cation/H+ antiporter subunit D [Phenylobacterium sp.]